MHQARTIRKCCSTPSAKLRAVNKILFDRVTLLPDVGRPGVERRTSDVVGLLDVAVNSAEQRGVYVMPLQNEKC